MDGSRSALKYPANHRRRSTPKYRRYFRPIVCPPHFCSYLPIAFNSSGVAQWNSVAPRGWKVSCKSAPRHQILPRESLRERQGNSRWRHDREDPAKQGTESRLAQFAVAAGLSHVGSLHRGGFQAIPRHQGMGICSILAWPRGPIRSVPRDTMVPSPKTCIQCHTIVKKRD